LHTEGLNDVIVIPGDLVVKMRSLFYQITLEWT